MNKPAPIVLAVDTNDLDIAKQWVSATDGVISVVKLGLEFYTTLGNDGIRAIADSCSTDIFLDLKLHDIPHTVAGAARAVADLSPTFITVHSSGGSSMVKAAVEALPDSKVTAVTILTSLSEEDLFEIGYANPALESAVALAQLSVKAGAKAIVCSPLEIEAIRAVIPQSVGIITPGVRPADEAGGDDQMRTITPAHAMRAGANFLVIGRPITSRWSEGKAAMAARAAQLVASIHE